jgi:hypothetical protein
MRKSVKDKLFETVKYGPFEAHVRLNGDGVFSCSYGGAGFSSEVCAEVRKWAHDRLRALAVLDWQPIMSVTFDAVDDRVNNLNNCANIRCFLERCWIAYDGKKWVETPWVVMPLGCVMCSGPNASEMEQENYPMPDEELALQRIRHSKASFAFTRAQLQFPVVEPESLGSKRYHVQYTKERWETMLKILSKMRELRSSIDKLLECDAGWKQLAAVAGAKLLGPPSAKPINQ